MKVGKKEEERKREERKEEERREREQWGTQAIPGRE